MNTPIYDELSFLYMYDNFTGWAFEDGPCERHKFDISETPCACDRPWSDAWMTLCDALRATDPSWDPDYRAYEAIKAKLRKAFEDEPGPADL